MSLLSILLITKLPSLEWHKKQCLWQAQSFYYLFLSVSILNRPHCIKFFKNIRVYVIKKSLNNKKTLKKALKNLNLHWNLEKKYSNI